MPVTRSSSRAHSQQPSNQSYSPCRAGSSGSRGNKTAPKPPSNEIIILSSDDDEPPPKGTLSTKKSSGRPRRKKASATPLVPAGDVLELSTDDESKAKKPFTRKHAQLSRTPDKDLQRTIKKLQEELKRSEKLLASTSREVEELKRDSFDKDVLSGLEEYTLCEVCTHTMWCPYILPECGHSFCETCLVNWFSTAQAHHLSSNPQLDANRAALVGQLHTFVQMVPNLHVYGLHGQNHVRAVLAELRRYRPEYTCPSCRKGVLNKPVEDFRLKGLIKEIAGMLGEIDPRKNSSLHRGTGPFDHFFAAPVSAR